jgi:flagellar biosynthesis/type III secretory pathway protein FliH
LRTFALPNGSITNFVDVKAVRVRKHLFRSDKFYVAIEFRNGSTEDVVEHLSRQAADDKQVEIAGLIREAWDEVDPYEYGHQTGRTEGRSLGWSDGFGAGRSEGYQNGWDNGWAEGRRSLLSELSERREVLMREQQYAVDLPPSRRRYLRDAISVLTEIIQYFNPEPAPNSEP